MSRLLLVLGMHRSGTSVVARSLECLGIELGEFSRWGGHDNPDFAEDKQVLAINEALLQENGLRWDSPIVGNIGSSRLRSIAIDLMCSRAVAYPLFGLKDPRMCRLLPFWRSVFSIAGLEVSVVNVIRHPQAVAQSLAKRNRLPLERGMALWVDHVTRQYDDVDHAWHSVTAFADDMIIDPGRFIHALGERLGLVVEKKLVKRFIDKSIQADLWHSPPNDDNLPTDVHDLWWQVQRTVWRV